MRTAATWRQIQNAHERNHAEPPTWLGLESMVAVHERTRQQHLEHPQQACREEPVKGAGVETAEIAADTTRRGAT